MSFNSLAFSLENTLQDIENNPPFTIFLDIDGVLYNGAKSHPTWEKAKELFPNHKGSFTDKMMDIAAAHFFDEKSIKNLGRILTEIGKTKKIYIIISSSWRDNRSVPELKNDIFSMHHFSHYILDKTPEIQGSRETPAYCKEHKEETPYYCRAAEIQCWLMNNPEFKDYIVLDDQDLDDHLTINFGKRFYLTRMNDLLTEKIAHSIIENHS